jgi:hypothetical protein
MRESPLEQILEASWYPFSDEPVIPDVWYVPRLSSPTFLFPEESPDGKWHLFAHSWLGIQHYTSDSGIRWDPMGVVQVRGKFPFLFKERGLFHIIYERHGRPIPFAEKLTKRMRKNHVVGSHIEMRTSSDLFLWSEPRILLEAKDVPVASDYMGKPFISHPQLIAVEGGYRLYFGASKVGRNPSSPRYICNAFSTKLDNTFVLESARPILEALPNDPYRSLASGRLSVYKEGEFYVGLQNGRYWDEERQREVSGMILLSSKDGLNWTRKKGPPTLVPAESGWASAHIIGADIRYKADEECWYCYFSATGEKRYGFFRESVGLLIGKMPTLRRSGRLLNLD